MTPELEHELKSVQEFMEGSRRSNRVLAAVAFVTLVAALACELWK